ncbi:hypothetical protein COV88_03185, partial [Candidatus Saccharibacteria bacterium CG11_big_fil_rev_8_21_14_0_20_41_19]
FSGSTIEVGVAANFWNNFRTADTADTGSNSAHNTIQPSIVKLSVIKYTAAAGSIDTTAKGTSVQGYWA